jgi:hypothetical protein
MCNVLPDYRISFAACIVWLFDVHLSTFLNVYTFYIFSNLDLYKVQFKFNSLQRFVECFITLCQSMVDMDGLAQLPTNNKPGIDTVNSTQHPPSKFRIINERLIAENLVGSGCEKNLNFARILPTGNRVK